ncbi:MAG: Rossmann-like and DUF2520 domain-containing protein [Bacteroidota bacterium]
MSFSFVFIGAGNLATHLAPALAGAGFGIRQVYSRTVASAESLAMRTGSSWTCSVPEIDTDADIYVVALKDSAVTEVLSQLNLCDKMIILCSGSLPISLLNDFSPRHGVLYPLQTFSRDRPVDFNRIPIFVEGSSRETEDQILSIAGTLSGKVFLADSVGRRKLHIAAVFSCNFVNYLYNVAADLLKNSGLEFEHLVPLIMETADKIRVMDPFDAQTGPAVRYDHNIINAHLEVLDNLPEIRNLYAVISEHIYKLHQK